MSQAYLIDELSDAMGVRIRKVSTGELFLLLRNAIENLDWLGIDERTEATGYGIFPRALYDSDEHGNIRELVIPNLDQRCHPIIEKMKDLQVLCLTDDNVQAPDLRILSSLPKLTHLVARFAKTKGDEALRYISQVKSLAALAILSDDPIDLALLRDLPFLKSLCVLECKVFNSQALATFPCLRNFGCKEIDDASALAQLQQIEKLFLWDDKADLSFLTDMQQLRSLYLEDREISLDIIRQLPNLTMLQMGYTYRTLEPLLSLKRLEGLELRTAKISDLSALHEFDRLSHLSLSGGAIEDISGLAGQSTISYLDVSRNPIAHAPSQLAMSNLKHLEWSSDNVRKIASGEFLSECPNLEILNLSAHALTDVGFVRSLKKMRVLNLEQNQLTVIRPLSELPNLANLNISNNRIQKLAPLSNNLAITRLIANNNPVEDTAALSALYRLEELNLSDTGVADLSFIKRLRNLFSLDLSGNQIDSIEPVLELPHIAWLDLSNNRLARISKEIVELRSLESLSLEENPVIGVDPEVYGGDGRKALQSLRDYYRGLSRGRAKHDQVKLLLVGNGRVGKTSIVSRLVDKNFDPNQPSTHGIQLRQWPLENVAEEKLDGKPLKINIWDFGGQDIYHATHRLFMKTRALFLLVWDKETENSQFSLDEFGERYETFRLPYWIDYIKSLSGSPVVIVQNKVDGPQDKQHGYGLELQQSYPQPRGILDYQYVSARKETQNGMAGLTESIVDALGNLESIGRELPVQWLEVRDRLATIDHRYIDYDRFVTLCASVGMQGTESLSLANFLHQAGTIFYQPDSFGNRLILDQKWAIEAVYALFDRRGDAYADLKIAGKNGLTLELLKRKVWRHFSEDEHQLLLEFMQSCELCFEFTKGVFYVPQLLPEEKPSRVVKRWKQVTPHCMQINYAYLHRAIIDRFLVRTGLLGADIEPEIWKNGIVILDDKTDTEAMVEAFPSENHILVQARGNAPVEMLHMIRKQFDELHHDFGAQVTFSADGGHRFVDAERLKQYSDANSTKVSSTEGVLVDLEPFTIFLTNTDRRLPKGELKATDRRAKMSLNQHVKLLRIVVASPGDVQGERDALPELIAEINRSVAADRNLRLELSRWETDTYPGFHVDGPQGGIDPILRIEDCDLLLGIFWRRFGTPTKDAGSGTEHEFKLAYQTWQKKGRPQLMVYFNQQAYNPKSKEETDQWGKVLEFRSKFPKEGLWWPYKGKAQFISLVRNHLTQYVRNLKPKALEVEARPRGEQGLGQQGQASPEPARMAAPPTAASLSPAQKLKRTTLEKQAAALLAQYQAVIEKLLYETNPATKVALKHQSEALLKEYEEKEAELRQVT